MVTNREFQDVIDTLKQQYGDFTKDSNSLRTMLQHNFQIVAKGFISMCDIKADKFYLWITADDSATLSFANNSISMMKLIHSTGFQIGREYEDEEGDDFDDGNVAAQNFQRAKEFYGTELFPNLNSFALRDITCNSQGATVLYETLAINTGWQLRHACPLVLHHQTYTFYQRGRSFMKNLDISPITERSCVLYDGPFRGRAPPSGVTWNGWDGVNMEEFRLYELSTNDIFSLNYPTGLAFI